MITVNSTLNTDIELTKKYLGSSFGQKVRTDFFGLLIDSCPDYRGERITAIDVDHETFFLMPESARTRWRFINPVGSPFTGEFDTTTVSVWLTILALHKLNPQNPPQGVRHQIARLRQLHQRLQPFLH